MSSVLDVKKINYRVVKYLIDQERIRKGEEEEGPHFLLRELMRTLHREIERTARSGGRCI